MRNLLSELLGVFLLAAALFLALALSSYSPQDPAFYFRESSRHTTENLAGPVGAFLAEMLLQLLGLGAHLLVVVLAVEGWNRFWLKPSRSRAAKFFGVAGLTLSLSGLLALSLREVAFRDAPLQAGGAVGRLVSIYLSAAVNEAGAFILLVAMLFASIVVATRFSFSQAFRRFSAWQRAKVSEILTAIHRYRETRRKERLRHRVVKKHARRALEEKQARADGAGLEDGEVEADSLSSTATVERRKPTPARQEMLPFTPKKGRWSMPPLTILEAPQEHVKLDEKELMELAKLLQQRSAEFAVEGEVLQIHPGPVVTTFEFKPEAGIKYSKITSLADDLCLALKAESVRIDRISGKSTVGIEIPNQNREQIGLREIVESEPFQASTSRLTIALGKTIDGAPYVTDITRMPHLLIAGATGAGKSVALNCMICSILCKSTPDEVKLVLIDPKRLELGAYQHIPHLLTPVVTDPKQASEVLKWSVAEMENRIRMLASEGVRNIEQFNNILKGAQEAGEVRESEDGEPLKPLPYVLLVIDELADLMMISSADVEEAITRLAQMARAVGIHLVLATQRPSVDVITGIIKANFPCRISFRVSSRVDSRTILDGNGAEQLLDKGDLLFLPPGSARLVRLHGPFVSEAEVGRLVSFWKRMGKPEYNDAVLQARERAEIGEFERDELFDEAARLVVRTGVASVSNLQRKLKLGYSRAARLMDMIEADGLVGPADGSKPREILVPPDYFDEVDRHLR